MVFPVRMPCSVWCNPSTQGNRHTIEPFGMVALKHSRVLECYQGITYSCYHLLEAACATGCVERFDCGEAPRKCRLH